MHTTDLSMPRTRSAGHGPSRSDACPEPSRRSWTPARQIAFLDTLATTRSVTRAAAAAGMSRESAHRLRNRRDGALFGALWDMALAPPPATATESHNFALSDGRLMRLLGNHFVVNPGNSQPSAAAAAGIATAHRTWPL